MEIICSYYRRDQMYDKDKPNVEVDFAKDGKHIIQPKAVKFPAKFSYGTIERRLLPTILSWTSTVHKMQGSTVDYAVVYLGSKLFADGQEQSKIIRGTAYRENTCLKKSFFTSLFYEYLNVKY